VGGGGSGNAAAIHSFPNGGDQLKAPIDTAVWPLVGITFCRPCQQPWRAYPAGRDRRFYLCAGCGDLQSAPPVERLVAAVAAERDWICAQRAGEPASWTRGWLAPAAVPLRWHLDRLVDRVTVAATEPVLDVRWRPIAVLPPHSRWLGPWIGPWASPTPDRQPPVPHR
jgi:hypothetical protein